MRRVRAGNLTARCSRAQGWGPEGWSRRLGPEALRPLACTTEKRPSRRCRPHPRTAGTPRELRHKRRAIGTRTRPRRHDSSCTLIAFVELGLQLCTGAFGAAGPPQRRPSTSAGSRRQRTRAAVARFARSAVAAEHYFAHARLVGWLTPVRQEEPVPVRSGGLRSDLNHARDRRIDIGEQPFIGTSMPARRRRAKRPRRSLTSLPRGPRCPRRSEAICA